MTTIHNHSMMTKENNIGNEGTTALSEALKHNTTLKSLGLGSQQKDIRKCTCNCSNKLDNLMTVTGNHVGLEGVKSLSEMLKENKTLRTLGISGFVPFFV